MPRRHYTVNAEAVAHVKELIAARRYVVRSRWQDAQPTARQGTTYLKTHSWDEYGAWHLGLIDGATEETKSRYGFIVGDFSRVHRTALIACVYRASEWDHKEVELAAHDLLQELDRRRAR